MPNRLDRLGNDPAFGKLKLMHGCLASQPAATAVPTVGSRSDPITLPYTPPPRPRYRGKQEPRADPLTKSRSTRFWCPFDRSLRRTGGAHRRRLATGVWRQRSDTSTRFQDDGVGTSCARLRMRHEVVRTAVFSHASARSQFFTRWAAAFGSVHLRICALDQRVDCVISRRWCNR